MTANRVCPLEAMLARWRYRAEVHEACFRDVEMPRKSRAEHAGEARATGLCANELEAAMRASEVSAEPLTLQVIQRRLNVDTSTALRIQDALAVHAPEVPNAW